jgi:hypothetical protein
MLCCQADTAMDVFSTAHAAQELSRLSVECGQLRAAAEETRAAAEEARRGRAALQVNVHCTHTQSPIAPAVHDLQGCERVCSPCMQSWPFGCSPASMLAASLVGSMCMASCGGCAFCSHKQDTVLTQRQAACFVSLLKSCCPPCSAGSHT